MLANNLVPSSEHVNDVLLPSATVISRRAKKLSAIWGGSEQSCAQQAGILKELRGATVLVYQVGEVAKGWTCAIPIASLLD